MNSDWIARPLTQLTLPEKIIWANIQTEFSEKNQCITPLSQSLTWAIANESSLKVPYYLLMNPSESLGGILYYQPNTQTLECINGPLYYWLHPNKLSRFMNMALKMALNLQKKMPIQGVRFLPRYYNTQLPQFEIPFETSSEAHTLNLNTRAISYTKRLQRTLKNSYQQKPLTEIKSIQASPELEIFTFAKELKNFGEKKHFFTPSFEWFQKLATLPELHHIENLNFVFVHTSLLNEKASLLNYFRGDYSAYLFGYRENQQSRSAVSASAVCHHEWLNTLKTQNIGNYDLNGWVKNPDLNHAYKNVAHFKNQWGGEPIEYLQAEWVLGV